MSELTFALIGGGVLIGILLGVRLAISVIDRGKQNDNSRSADSVEFQLVLEILQALSQPKKKIRK